MLIQRLFVSINVKNHAAEFSSLEVFSCDREGGQFDAGGEAFEFVAVGVECAVEEVGGVVGASVV
jgi:hypothetical protein